jgi:hypothetical protein
LPLLLMTSRLSVSARARRASSFLRSSSALLSEMGCCKSTGSAPERTARAARDDIGRRGSPLRSDSRMNASSCFWRSSFFFLLSRSRCLRMNSARRSNSRASRFAFVSFALYTFIISYLLITAEHLDKIQDFITTVKIHY